MMNKLNNLQSIEAFTLKCVLSKTPDFAEVFEGELIWEETKLRLRYLCSARTKDETDERFYGEGNNGERFTLLKSVLQHSEFNKNGLMVKTYLITEYIASSIYELDQYDILSVNFSHVPEWLRINLFDFKYGEDDDFIEAILVKKVKPIKQKVSIASEDIELIFNPTFIINQDFRNINLNQLVTIQIVPRNPKGIQWFLEVLSKLKDLFTLMVGRRIYTLDLEFKQGAQRVTYYNDSYIDFKHNSKLNYAQVLISYQAVSNDFIFKKWFSLVESQAQYGIIKLLISNLYLEQFSETVFLNYMQGIEGYHRIMYSGGYISEKDFRTYRKRISNFVDTLDLDKDLKNSIKERLIHSYEYSLQKRLHDIIFSIDKCILELFFSTEEEIERFIKDIKRERNNLTHPNDQSNNKDSEKDFANYNRILKVIFMCILFKELGFTGEFIRDCLLVDREYNLFIPNKPDILMELPILSTFEGN